jgi:hypothetical protein
MLKPTMMSSLIMVVLLGLTGSCDAAFTFFTNRPAWEAEVNARSWLFAEENFDAFANGTPIPSFTVGAGTLPGGAFSSTPARDLARYQRGDSSHLPAPPFVSVPLAYPVLAVLSLATSWE